LSIGAINPIRKPSVETWGRKKESLEGEDLERRETGVLSSITESPGNRVGLWSREEKMTQGFEMSGRKSSPGKHFDMSEKKKADLT